MKRLTNRYDGFTALKNRPFLVDDETGLMISSIVRSFLLGSSYIFRHKQFRESHEAHLSSRTKVVLDKARREHHSPSNSPTSSPRTTHSKLNLTSPPVSPYSGMREPNPWDSPASTGTGNGRRHVVNHSWAAIRDAMHVAKHEHLSEVDCLVSHVIQRRYRALIGSKASRCDVLLSSSRPYFLSNGRTSRHLKRPLI